MPALDVFLTMKYMNGSVASMTSVRSGSRVTVTITPPTTSIGALMPSLNIIPII